MSAGKVRELLRISASLCEWASVSTSVGNRCSGGRSRKGLLPGRRDTHQSTPDLLYSGAGPPAPRGAEGAAALKVTGEGGCACGHPAELSHPAQQPGSHVDSGQIQED